MANGTENDHNVEYLMRATKEIEFSWRQSFRNPEPVDESPRNVKERFPEDKAHSYSVQHTLKTKLEKPSSQWEEPTEPE